MLCFEYMQKTAAQVLVVNGFGRRAKISLYERDRENKWRRIFGAHGYLGRNGMGKKQEGDGKTPVGVYRIGRLFGIRKNPGSALPYTKVDPSHYWVCDSESTYYNQLVSTRETLAFDRAKSEHLVSYGPLYRYCINMGYNTSCIPYMGSALFIHCGDSPTLGCIAIPEKDMIQLLRRLQAGALLVCRPVSDKWTDIR